MKIVIGGVRGIPARYGGFETSVEETARRMQNLGHHVTVYCRAQAGAPDRPEYAGIELVHLKVAVPKFLETIAHSIAVGLHVMFNSRNADVVHLYNAASVFGGLIIKAAGKPLIMTLDGVEWEREKWNWVARRVWKAATWLAMRVADTVVCDSRTVQSLFERRYGAKTKYIPYGAKCIEDVSDFYKRFALGHKQYSLFVGRLVPEKRVDVLLEAYSALSTDLPLVIVGDNHTDPGYVSWLHSRAGENVVFLGYRYGDDYESLLKHARIYLTASELEGTSPSLLAAMGARVACIVNSIRENRETGGDSVVYFDGSVSDLAEKWRTLSEDESVLNEYASRGYERVVSHYDWDVATNEYLTVYREASVFGETRKSLTSAAAQAWDGEKEAQPAGKS